MVSFEARRPGRSLAADRRGKFFHDEESRWRRRGFFFCECPSFGPPLPYQRCDAGTPSAFNSLYVTSEILMLWTPNPVRTSAHHTVREAGVALNDPECQSVSLPATASCRHVVRSSDGSAKLSSIPGMVAREAARLTRYCEDRGKGKSPPMTLGPAVALYRMLILW